MRVARALARLIGHRPERIASGGRARMGDLMMDWRCVPPEFGARIAGEPTGLRGDVAVWTSTRLWPSTTLPCGQCRLPGGGG